MDDQQLDTQKLKDALSVAAKSGTAGLATELVLQGAKKYIKANQPIGFAGEVASHLGSSVAGGAIGAGLGALTAAMGFPLGGPTALIGASRGAALGAILGQLARTSAAERKLQNLKPVVALDKALRGGLWYTNWALKHPVLSRATLPFARTPIVEHTARVASEHVLKDIGRLRKIAPLTAAILLGVKAAKDKGLLREDGGEQNLLTEG